MMSVIEHFFLLNKKTSLLKTMTNANDNGYIDASSGAAVCEQQLHKDDRLAETACCNYKVRTKLIHVY